MTNKPTKETIYIDIEDEITAIIDKVISSEHKIVAVVLPKRATVFQSPVNMKLLKRAATAARKNLALVTSDPAVLPIAAMAGVLVAKTPSSKPSVPELLEDLKPDEDILIEGEASESADKASDVDDEDEPIELDNDDKLVTEVSAVGPVKLKKSKLKIPNFSNFKVRLALAALALVLLTGGWVLGFVVLPKATISLDTNVSTLPINTVVTARIGAEQLDLETNVVPAERVQVEKTDDVKVPATGQKNIGEKATGKLTLTNCINDGEDKIVPAGTVFSASGLSFVTTQAVELDFAVFAGSNCLSSNFGRSKDVSVQAVNPGPESNLTSRSYTSSISGIQASGTDMTGGTTQVVKVISQEDVDKAKTELEGIFQGEALNELKQQLTERGLMSLEVTFAGNTPKIDVTPAVGQEASEVTVKSTVIYSISGIKEEDLKALLDKEVNSKLSSDDQKKKLQDNGLKEAKLQLNPDSNEQDIKLTLDTIARIGPTIDIEQLKKDFAGKKRGEIQNTLLDIDGVTNVVVNYSPSWITTTPKSSSKIDIKVNELSGN